MSMVKCQSWSQWQWVYHRASFGSIAVYSFVHKVSDIVHDHDVDSADGRGLEQNPLGQNLHWTKSLKKKSPKDQAKYNKFTI